MNDRGLNWCVSGFTHDPQTQPPARRFADCPSADAFRDRSGHAQINHRSQRPFLRLVLSPKQVDLLAIACSGRSDLAARGAHEAEASEGRGVDKRNARAPDRPEKTSRAKEGRVGARPLGVVPSYREKSTAWVAIEVVVVLFRDIGSDSLSDSHQAVDGFPACGIVCGSECRLLNRDTYLGPLLEL